MPYVRADRIKENAVPFSADFELQGALDSYRSFAAVCLNNDTVDAVIRVADGATFFDWEVAHCRYNASLNTLERISTYSSSNSDAPVDFATINEALFISLVLPAAALTAALGNIVQPQHGNFLLTDGSGAALTLVTRNGRYWKHGHLLVMTIEIEYPTTANSNQAILGSFPFTLPAGAIHEQGSITYSNNLDLKVIAVAQGGNFAFIEKYDGNPALNSDMSGVFLNATFTIIFETIPDGDPFFLSVVSLMHFEDVINSITFIDVKGKTWTAAGNAIHTTTTPLRGISSYVGDGTGDVITTPDHADFEFGTGNFTIELLIRPVVVTGTSYIFSKINVGGIGYTVYRNGASLEWYCSSNGTTWDMCSAVVIGTIAANTTYHVAVCREGNTFRTFLNGVAGATGTSSASIINNTNVFAIGAASNAATASFNGRIDEFRVTKGVARYNGNFTPPIAPHPDF